MENEMKRISHYVSLLLFIALLIISIRSNAEPYIGLSLGQATLDICDRVPSGIGLSCDDTDTAFKIYGGYKFNKNAAFEASYIDMGEAFVTDGFTTVTAESTAINFSVLGIIPASNTVDIFGKLGFAFWDVKLNVSEVVVEPIDDDGTDIMFGAGVNYRVSEQFALRAEFERFNNVGSETTTDKSDVTILSVGGIVYF